MADATCTTCPFWWYRSEDGKLLSSECRRHPPRTVTNARPGDPGQPVDPHWHMFPVAQPDDWCGEHPERAAVAGRVQLTRDVLEVADAVCFELGGAEWADAAHAEEILRGLIRQHWSPLRDALHAHPLHAEVNRG